MSTAPANSHESPNTEAECPSNSQQTFSGLQPLRTKADRFYKFYITDNALYAAWLGGQFHDKFSVRLQLSPLYVILVGFIVAEPVACWADNRRRRLEQMYDLLVSNPDDFLVADNRNFQIARDDVTSITASSRKSPWTMWTNTGILTFNSRGGNPLKIIVRASHPMDAIIHDLIAYGYPVAG